MPAIQSIWSSTPNKKDNLTLGWTSKTLFNYQSVGGVLVADGSNFLEEIATTGENYKGTYILPAKYFEGDNPQDSRTFKITVLFDKQNDGYDMSIWLGLYDIDNDLTYTVKPAVNTGTRNSLTSTLSKLEYYCCVYVEPTNGYTIMSVVGTIMYEKDATGSATTIIQPYSGYKELTNGTTPSYSFVILNTSTQDVTPHSLVIEELG